MPPLTIHTSTLLESFGSLRLGNTDDALDRMDGALPHNWDIEGNHALQANVGGDQTEENISFISPNISGVTLLWFDHCKRLTQTVWVLLTQMVLLPLFIKLAELMELQLEPMRQW